MKKLKLFIVAFIMVVSVCSNNISNSSAEDYSKYVSSSTVMCPYFELSQIVHLKQGEVLLINGKENSLFWEFSDYSDAFDKMREYNSVILTSIKNKNSFLDLNQENWKLYFKEFQDIYSENDISDNNMAIVLEQFFVVCENHEINNQAKLIYNSSNYDIFELANYLPYTNPIMEDVQESMASIPSLYMIPNLDKSLKYAKTYATNPNTKEYNYYAGKDCANFVSQIIKAGGKSEDNTWKRYSTTWTSAHGFVVYWYAKTNSKTGWGSFKAMSSYLDKGDIIAYDKQKDGRYDHVGFVVDKGTFNNTGAYQDVTIAQHSGNYCGKVSKEAKGWKDIKGTLVRIRV